MQNQNEQVYKLPVTIMRGGTSKGIYILESDLPENREEWDAILLRLMGSPDSKQIGERDNRADLQYQHGKNHCS